MIPLRLTVKNFMCYQSDVPTLDLEGLHVACLCGDNGHGKSALLDAITWALWGQARARTQEELVHQGQRDMAVELEFLARGQRYRISRKYSRSARAKQGASILELQVASDDGFRSVTGNLVRETEEQVREILHMDYDTFINTAFLRQGDADRFTTSRPAERKGTLAAVLDLSYYEGLEARAKARSRAIHEEAIILEQYIAVRQGEIDRRPQLEDQLTSVKVDLERTAPEVEFQRQRIDDLRRRVDSLQVRRLELEDLSRRLADHQKDIVQLSEQVKNHESKMSAYDAVLQNERELRQQFDTLTQTRTELEQLNRALARKSELDNMKAPLDRDVAVQRERVEGQVAQFRRTIADDLEPKSQRLTDIEEALRTVDSERSELVDLERTIERQREEDTEVSDKVRDLTQANERLRRQMEETRDKFDMLGAADTLCPLCRQPLGDEGQEHLRKEFEAEGTESKWQFQLNLAELKTRDRMHEELAKRLSALVEELNQRRQAVQNKASRLERDLEESRKARDELEPARQGLANVQALLSANDFAHDERRALLRLEAEILALGYDVDTHREEQQRAKALEGSEELHRTLREAEKNLPSEREALESASQLLNRRQDEMRAVETRRTVLEAELRTLPTLSSEMVQVESSFRMLEESRRKTLVEMGVLEKALEKCDALALEISGFERKRGKLLNERSIYDELAVAFGKNGIQALIIETAIPQLEADANELLSRLTENRMFLRLQLQEGRRDSRTGQPSEELAIRIADEVGTRSYETFSGGEAFRINFALRIALSKLLARRSGAPLPILFIDEGFGSQDSAGQERLTEAIRAIQDDFQKIIVITHIDRVKELFPVRIEVTKTGSGSTFEVI